MASECLLECRPRLPQTALLRVRLRPALESSRRCSSVLRAELERACERLLRPVDVEAERPLTGQREVSDRLRLELVRCRMCPAAQVSSSACR